MRRAEDKGVPSRQPSDASSAEYVRAKGKGEGLEIQRKDVAQGIGMGRRGRGPSFFWGSGWTTTHGATPLPKPDTDLLGGVVSSSSGQVTAAGGSCRFVGAVVTEGDEQPRIRTARARIGSPGFWGLGAGPDPSEGPTVFGCESAGLAARVRHALWLRCRSRADQVGPLAEVGSLEARLQGGDGRDPPNARFGDPAPEMDIRFGRPHLEAPWLAIGLRDGVPVDAALVSKQRAHTIESQIGKRDTNVQYRFETAAGGWIRHDGGLVLALRDQVLGQPPSDTFLTWRPRHPAEDPLVYALGFTNRTARTTRMSGIVLSINEALEDHFVYSDGLDAQSVVDANAVADLIHFSGDWREFRARNRLFAVSTETTTSLGRR